MTVSAEQQDIILNDLSARLVLPYMVIGLVLIGLGLVIKFTKLPDIDDETANKSAAAGEKENVWKHTHLIFGAIAIFCGVGVEVLAIDSIINYAQFTGLSFRAAKYFATYTLLLMIISYIIGILTIPKIIKQRKALLFSAVLGIALTMLTILIKGPVSVWFIALLGLGNALLWPAIWPLSLEGLGKATSKGSALLIMGVVGGAVSPLLYGMISDASNPQIAYSILIPFYLFILYFAVAGYKAGKTIS
jgi:fucose permease